MGIKDLPLDDGRTITKVFQSLGWEAYRGKNHFVLTHPNRPGITISIPDHKEVDRALLRAELRKAQIDTGDFAKAYQKI